MTEFWPELLGLYLAGVLVSAAWVGYMGERERDLISAWRAAFVAYSWPVLAPVILAQWVGAMKRIFEIEWPDDSGALWMNKSNLLTCLTAYCRNTTFSARDVTGDGLAATEWETAQARGEAQ